MKKYLIIESKGSHGANWRGLELSIELANSGFPITLWLLQDAIQLLQMKNCALLDQCISHQSIKIFVDDFALSQRGCEHSFILEKGISIGSIDVLSAHLMCNDNNPIWH